MPLNSKTFLSAGGAGMDLDTGLPGVIVLETATFFLEGVISGT